MSAFFKKARIYTLPQEWRNPENFNALLAECAFKPCGRTQFVSSGFVSPFSRKTGDGYATPVLNGYVVCRQQQERVLPAQAVNEALQAKLDELAKHGRVISRKERSVIKEDIVLAMLPNAFLRSRFTTAYIDLKHNRIVVNESSASRAEDLTSLLRSAFGSLPVKPFLCERQLETHFTNWLKLGRVNRGEFHLGFHVDLKNISENGGTIKIRNEPAKDEAKPHIEKNAMIATAIGLEWTQRDTGGAWFVINKDGALSSIGYSVDILDKVDRSPDNPELDYQSELIMSMTTLDGIIQDLELSVNS